MSTCADLLEQTYQQLENRAGYTAEELCTNGLTPAMQLLCLLDPTLHTVSTVVTLPALSLTLDLRTVLPRTQRLLRVVAGQVASDRPAGQAGSPVVPLLATTRARRARVYPAWLTHVGIPTHWFLLGAHTLCCTPRPVAETTLTLVAAAIPPAVDPNNLTQSPALDAGQHPLLSDLAQHLVLIKMGVVEAERALQVLQQRIAGEPLTSALKQLRSMQRAAPVAAATP